MLDYSQRVRIWFASRLESLKRDWHLIVIPVSIFGIWVSCHILWLSTDAKEKIGQFGDMFGWVNSLFSGLACIGLIYTLFLQIKQNDQQRKDASGQGEQLERTAKANEATANALMEQAKLQLKAARIAAKSALLSVYCTRLTALYPDLDPSSVHRIEEADKYKYLVGERDKLQTELIELAQD